MLFEYKRIINKEKYQVFLFSSPIPYPLNFAVHTWFVINLKGKISRWEFGQFKGSPHKNGIGVLKNFFEPTEGMNKYFWKSYPRFTSKLIDFIEGDENSTASNLAEFIENFSDSYPLKDKYILTGPNSNTFVQWIINQYPEANIKLPFNAVGKGSKALV